MAAFNVGRSTHLVTDENRSRVVEAGLLSNELIRILEDDSILPFAVPVIYNICVDYGKDFFTGTV